MILAGIDEAGLGPAMGPLCVCAAVLRLHDPALAADGVAFDDAPALAAWPWQRLAGLVARVAKEKEPPLLVTDSKIAHKVRGVAGLEAAALAFHLAARADASLDRWQEGGGEALLADCGAGDALQALPGCAWYAPEKWVVPLHAGRELILSCARRLREAEGVCPLQMRARVMTEKMLNALFARGLNKSEVLLLQTGAHLRAVYEAYPQEETLIVVDKQGGRNFYAPFLSETLGGAWVNTVCEGATLSSYEVARSGGGAPVRILFLPKADAMAFPVALASLLAKYLRERFMDDLNAWFCARIPGLEPTAGYHGDAPRFMEAIRPFLLQHGISPAFLWRER